jgi:hypothetical protein
MDVLLIALGAALVLIREWRLEIEDTAAERARTNFGRSLQ